MVSSKIIPLSNNLTVCMEVQSARVVRVTPLNEGVEMKEGDKIIGLNYNNEVACKVGDILDINKQKYKVKCIFKNTDPANGVGYHIHTHIINKSSMFILPLLGLGQDNRNHFRWSQNLCNCFVGTEKDKDYGRYIYLLYRFDASKEFSIFEKRLKDHPWFKSTSDPDGYHVMFQFEPDNMLKRDYDLLLDGKYSKISDLTKDRILAFHASAKNKPLGQILYKAPERKAEMEKQLLVTIKDEDLYDMFYVKDEIYLEDYRIKNTQFNEFGSQQNSGFC